MPENCLWLPYTQMKTAGPPLRVVSAEGIYLITDDHRRIIDGISSWWTACHGHRHPHIVAALKQQLDRLDHVMLGGIEHPPARQLAERLANLLPGELNHVFFSDSGSVAVEIALKICKQYWLNQRMPEASRFVCFRYAYHGDTTGAMSVCDPVDSLHRRFRGFLLEQLPVDLPSNHEELQTFDRFLQRHRRSIAGVIIEPLVQAAAGMKFHSPGQLADLADCVRRNGLLLIADEIATGFGRTGTMFACQQAEVVPDVICLGKGLSGGALTLAATVATSSVFSKFCSDDPEDALQHGPTYMGNPLACAAANASLDLFEREPRLSQVRQLETWAREAWSDLDRYSAVREVRFRGAWAVVELDRELPVGSTSKAFVSEGVWLRPLRNTLYLAPPFVCTEAEWAHCTGAVRRFVAELSS